MRVHAVTQLHGACSSASDPEERTQAERRSLIMRFPVVSPATRASRAWRVTVAGWNSELRGPNPYQLPLCTGPGVA